MEEENVSEMNKKYINLEEFHKNSAGTFDMKSVIPDMAKSEPCCMGIDEAGRGPVLGEGLKERGGGLNIISCLTFYPVNHNSIGPMVYSTSYCPLSQDEKLKELGFAG
jgi:ribonuclease H2 subunit A